MTTVDQYILKHANWQEELKFLRTVVQEGKTQALQQWRFNSIEKMDTKKFKLLA